MKHLERDEPLVSHILREIHRCHPAAAELAIDCVTLRKRPAKTLERECHRHIAR
jgi:hypothetical protein